MKLHYQALTFHLMSHVTAATSTPATSKVILLINPRHMQGNAKLRLQVAVAIRQSSSKTLMNLLRLNDSHAVKNKQRRTPFFVLFFTLNILLQTKENKKK